jgi:hypothetical protein
VITGISFYHLEMDPKLFVHVYISSAVTPFSKSELQALLTQAREHNASRGITGLLLAHDGNFMQMLEGPEKAVRELAAKIHKDPRHSGVITLLEEPAERPQFPEWKMGFRDLKAPGLELPIGFSDFMNTSLSHDEFAKDPSRCQRLLQTFKKNQR